MKKTFYCEAAYAIGLACLALSTALMATADFGVSMVVAPAYILHLKVSEFLPFFSFGMAEYLLQLVLIVLLAVVLRRVKLSYPASFATAVLYGFLLDGFLALVALLPVTVLAVRIAMFVAGFFLCAGSISLLFHTYVPPEAYELVVKEFSAHFGWKIHRVKTVYDCRWCFSGSRGSRVSAWARSSARSATARRSPRSRAFWKNAGTSATASRCAAIFRNA